MPENLSLVKVGIVGTGRLGRALGARLAESSEVIAWDVDIKKAKQFAKQWNLEFATDLEQIFVCDLVLLCIPAQAVAEFFLALPSSRTYTCKFVNMASDVDTPLLIEQMHLHRLQVIGLKLIGQFAAVRHGIRSMFVTTDDNLDNRRLLDSVFQSIGDIRTGDERKVREINRAATKLALKFCEEFGSSVRPQAENAHWVSSALKSVVAGTILDYPPDKTNPYTARILSEIAEERLSAQGLARLQQSPGLEVGP